MNQSYSRGRGRGNLNNKGGRGGKGSNGQSSQFQSQFPHFNQFQFQQAQSNSNDARSKRSICQIYGKVGHLALDCYHRIDYAYQGKHPSTKLAAMATASNAYFTQDQPWLADSAATYHVTSSLNHLSFPKPYQGQDHITIGNRQTLPITHLGNTSISLPYSTLHLNDVLIVPFIASNLASVHKICHDNQCWCYFDKNIISIQALATEKILYHGKSEDGVYSIYP